VEQTIEILLTCERPGAGKAGALPADPRGLLADAGGRWLGESNALWFATFANYQTALSCARALQEACDWGARIGVSIATVHRGDGVVGGAGLNNAVAMVRAARAGQIVFSTICDAGRTGAITRGYTTTRPDGPLAPFWAVVQHAALFGFFAFWMGLIAWRLYYYAKYNAWPCVPEFLCG
jgi:hypothetical protein